MQYPVVINDPLIHFVTSIFMFATSLYVRRLLARTTTIHVLQDTPHPCEHLLPTWRPACILYFARHDHQLKYNIPVEAIEAYKFSFYAHANAAIHVALPPSGFRLL